MKKTGQKILSLILVATLLASLTASGIAAAHAEAEDVVETILTVCTTQAFTDEPVPAADVKTILQAGLAAESAINQQPWYLVAITDKAVMAEISGSSAGSGMTFTPPSGSMPKMPQGDSMPQMPQGDSMPEMPEGGAMLQMPQGGMTSFGSGSAKASLGDSPLAIVVYMSESTSSPNPSFDCGLAVQNMYLAAASLGYGVKIISSPTRALNGENHDAICEKLGVDPSFTAVAVLLIGQADTAVDGVSGASVRSGLEEKTNIVD